MRYRLNAADLAILDAGDAETIVRSVRHRKPDRIAGLDPGGLRRQRKTELAALQAVILQPAVGGGAGQSRLDRNAQRQVAPAHRLALEPTRAGRGRGVVAHRIGREQHRFIGEFALFAADFLKQRPLAGIRHRIDLE